MANDDRTKLRPDAWASPQAAFGIRWSTRLALRWDAMRDRSALLLAAERDYGAAFLWSPVWLGLGILVYFALPREPLPFTFALMAVLATAVWLRMRGTTFGGFLVLTALICGGAALAQFETMRVDTIMPPRTTFGEIGGEVKRVERRSDGSARVVLALADDRGDGLKTARLTLRKLPPGLAVGDRLNGQARYGPPPGPSYPGAYDFAFTAWFDGIGASGFFLGAPDHTPAATQEWSRAAWRGALSEIIRDASPGQPGALAAALMVGDRSGIAPEVTDALRASGLAHILAISGLHMTLVAGTVLVLMRSGLALVPGMTLRYPVKKWAAGTALAIACGYLLLSGATVSARRAFVMVAVMLLAVLLDRRALTMRNVSLAALIILVLTPHAILLPGFQMSFAAVAALISAYEGLRQWRLKRERGEHTHSPFRKVIQYGGGMAFTALIAGTATGLFAAYHFQRIAPFGLVGNVLAMPVVSTIVMPSALVSALAMPFGLEQFPLTVMGWGTSLVVRIAHWVASLGTLGATGFIPVASLLLGTVALLVLTLGRTNLRWVALVPAILALPPLVDRSTPAALVSENGEQIGVIDDNSLALLKPNANKFTTNMWRQAYAPAADGGKAAENATKTAARVTTTEWRFTPERGRSVGSTFACDDHGCVTNTRDGFTILQAATADRFLEDCRRADVIVMPFPAARSCLPKANGTVAVLLDRTTLQRHGSHAIYRGDDGSLHVRPARPTLKRPWNAHFTRTR